MKDRVKTCPTHLIWGVPCNNCPKFDLNELKYCQFKNYLTKYQNTKASYPYPIKVLYNFRLLNIKHDQRKSSPSLKAEQFNNRVSHFGTFFSDSLATSPSMVDWSKQHADFFSGLLEVIFLAEKLLRLNFGVKCIGKHGKIEYCNFSG